MVTASDIAVSVRGLTKSYTIAHTAVRRPATLAEAALARLRNPMARARTETFNALTDVSFDVRRGEVVGIIGRNGAGKSTLLKILSRITEPTAGRLDLYGRVGSLLEVGTGFHPELSGRENVFLNGAILGMGKAEIRKQFDAIVDFAGVEQFLDTPVKRYSSGMYVRLAFAVAAHLRSDVLIIDEVLAVGDAEFQARCLGKMRAVSRDQGRTVLFVSHNVGAIRALCKGGLLLDGGRLVSAGPVESVLRAYLGSATNRPPTWARTDPPGPDAAVYFDRVDVAGVHGGADTALDSSDAFVVTLTYIVRRPLTGSQLALRVTNQDGVDLFTTANSDAAGAFVPLAPGRHVARITIPGRFLPPGAYSATIAALTPHVDLYDLIDGRVGFTIEDFGTHATLLRDGRLGVVTPMIEWKDQPDAQPAAADPAPPLGDAVLQPAGVDGPVVPSSARRPGLA